MKRRAAIRNILLASAGTIFITGCADKNVIEFLADGQLELNSRHKDYLLEISNAFLPLGDLQEKVGNPVDFIMTMLNDCHPPEEVQLFAQGFEDYKTLMEKSRLELDASEAELAPVVEKVYTEQEVPQEALIYFINKTKSLSIQHLTSSSYYMTNYLDYSLVPQKPFDGCAPA